MNNKEELSIKRRMKRIENMVTFSKKPIVNFQIDEDNIQTEIKRKKRQTPKNNIHKISNTNETLLSFQRNVKLVMDQFKIVKKKTI